jgi:MFS family permease
VAAAASSLFSVGALLAAPVGGRLADRVSPVAVAVGSKLVAAAGAAGLVAAGSPVTFLLGMFVFGVGITAANPAQTVLVLRWVGGGEDRRRVFAWQFTGQALGMAVGAFVAGYVVDLDRLDGMTAAFATAAAGFVLSALLILAAGRGAPRGDADGLGVDAAAQAPGGISGRAAVRLLWASPPLRWTALVTVTLALGFYAQFESGLPAYALTVLSVEESVIGLAAAVNCVVIIALQMVVVRLTARRSAPALLMGVASIWTLSWLLLAVATQAPGLAAALFVTTFGVFAVGETMYAPVLNPLTASLAPAGTVGTTLGIFTALQTGVSALGPLVAGVVLGAGLGAAFIGLHVAVSVLALFAAWRLRQSLRAAAPEAVATTSPSEPVLAA